MFIRHYRYDRTTKTTAESFVLTVNDDSVEFMGAKRGSADKMTEKGLDTMV